MDIEDLLKRLFNLTYLSEGKFEYDIIADSKKPKVEDEIRKWAKCQDAEKELLDKDQQIIDMAKELGVLQAKVYTYEQIIANSNFALMLQPKTFNDCEQSYLQSAT